VSCHPAHLVDRHCFPSLPWKHDERRRDSRTLSLLQLDGVVAPGTRPASPCCEKGDESRCVTEIDVRDAFGMGDQFRYRTGLRAHGTAPCGLAVRHEAGAPNSSAPENPRLKRVQARRRDQRPRRGGDVQHRTVRVAESGVERAGGLHHTHSVGDDDVSDPLSPGDRGLRERDVGRGVQRGDALLPRV